MTEKLLNKENKNKEYQAIKEEIITLINEKNIKIKKLEEN